MLLNEFLLLGAVLFAIGVYGVIARKNAVLVLMSIELILNSVNINLLAFALRNGGDATGHTFALFIIAVAAADLVLIEASVAGPDGVLAVSGSRAAASVAYCSEIPVWAVAGVGRRLPEPLAWSLGIVPPSIPPRRPLGPRWPGWGGI